ncbi:MAG: glycosyltransferase [Candidatus Hydrogenedentes bacterium]|nr:glycosyltransferase [Candidatus Hydrogenedentota bacterium]
MATPRILTFNFHEPYLCLMAMTGLPLTVGQYAAGSALARQWQTKFRPVPANVTIVPESVWRPDLAAGRFDVVVAQNETNAWDIFKETAASQTPALVVCHNRKSFLKTTLKSQKPEDADVYDRLLLRLREHYHFVFISESKRADYNIPGTVIPPGIDVEQYGGYHGETPQILRVGNMMRARNLMFDVDLQDQVCAGLPNRVVGEDPTIPGATPSTSFYDLLSAYRSLRCLLHVTCEDWEDGYNLSMLEAMACGMPVVSLGNRTSPLTDGTDGFTSRDAGILRARLQGLLADSDLAREIGARGRETVAKRFPLSAFVQAWRGAIESAAEARARPQLARRSGPKLNILTHSVCSPITTARYLEAALKQHHDVVTAGLRVPEQLLTQWGFPGVPPEYPQHTIDLPLESNYEALLGQLPAGFKQDLFFWIDSGVKTIPADLNRIEALKACYMIDTHIAPEPRIEIARQFNFTFLAQKRQIEQFVQAGVPNVAWLPLACAAELHTAAGAHERVYDVSYVGRLSEDSDDRRRNLIRDVAARFPNCRTGMFWPHEMATIYAQSKIVINACVNHDLNMRVFEAMGAGALLITDEADGLHELFEEGKHLVVYRSHDEALELIARYLADDEARQRIAMAGQTHVLTQHTYAHRMEHMLSMILDTQQAGAGYTGEGRFHAGGYYRCPRPELAAQIPSSAQRVLDCGCGAGEFGRSLKMRGVKEVVGIEVVERAWKIAKQTLDDAILGSIEEIELPFADGYFDCICFGDVLEHLVDPSAALRKVSRVLAPDGVIVMSIPNIRFYQTIEMLVNGRWKYEDAGILDRTHLRFFAAPDMKEMVEAAGLRVVRVQPLSMLPPERLPRNPDGSITIGRATLNGLSDAEHLDLCVYQYLVVGAKPEADLLAPARRASDAGNYEEAYTLAQDAAGADEFNRQNLLGRAVARLGKLDTAEQHYRAALALRPSDARVQGELGILLVAMNRPNDAKPFLEWSVKYDSDNERVIAALGLVYLAQGDQAAAFARFKQALTTSFHNESVQCHFIQTAYALRRLDEAEPLVRKFVDFYPGNIGMSYNYAAMVYKLGRLDEARDRLETLLLLSPGYEPAQELLAEISRGPAQSNE